MFLTYYFDLGLEMTIGDSMTWNRHYSDYQSLLSPWIELPGTHVTYSTTRGILIHQGTLR